MSLDATSRRPATHAVCGCLLLGLAPGLIAIAMYPGFVTQDGPAHAYNAEILRRSFDPASPFRAVFEVRWSPVPNWAGHLGLLALSTILTPRAADRIMMAATLLGVGASAMWLRFATRGQDGWLPATLLSCLAAMNLAWLLGFESFLLGTCLLVATLRTWWAGRHATGWRHPVGVGVLLLAGYVAHLVSLGLTAASLVVLAAAGPAIDRRRRLTQVALPLIVLAPLAVLYRSQMSAGGEMDPTWHEMTDLFSARSWIKQLSWIDPITLGRRVLVPFSDRATPWAILLSPAMWALAAIACSTWIGGATRPASGDDAGERRPWRVLSAGLIGAGLLIPDSFGPGHGDYLAQRVLLVGLIVLITSADFGRNRRADRVASGLLAVAVAIQSAYLCDYARTSDAMVRRVLAVRREVGVGQRVGSLTLGLRGRFRANPLMHADCLLGIGTGNVIWGNYEAAHYYFPVHYRAGYAHFGALEFEEISKLDLPGDATARRDRWRALLEQYRGEIDRILIITTDPSFADPEIDRITARSYEPMPPAGPARVWWRLPR